MVESRLPKPLVAGSIPVSRSSPLARRLFSRQTYCPSVERCPGLASPEGQVWRSRGGNLTRATSAGLGEASWDMD